MSSYIIYVGKCGRPTYPNREIVLIIQCIHFHQSVIDLHQMNIEIITKYKITKGLLLDTLLFYIFNMFIKEIKEIFGESEILLGKVNLNLFETLKDSLSNRPVFHTMDAHCDNIIKVIIKKRYTMIKMNVYNNLFHVP